MWDRLLHEYAASQLTATVNEWANDDSHIIYEGEFSDRIMLMSIDITSEGSFVCWFDADVLFTDHTIEITGDISNGTKYADIIG